MRPGPAAAVGLCVLLFAAAAARADRRVALVVGDNTGNRSEPALLYARRDAGRLARVLRLVGGFEPGDVVVLEGATAAEVRIALDGLEARLRRHPGPSLLLVYYSGHADAEDLHLGGTLLPLAELSARLARSAATARVLVVDACRSGALTRVKGGGHAAAAFAVHLVPAPARGTAILTSSAAGEDSEESDRIAASFFTYHLVSALLGAADQNRDGVVTLGEAFSYTADRTVAATADTVVGPQHPTYRLDLGGRRDLALTMPGARAATVAQLELGAPGRYLVQRRDRDGEVVAEVAARRAGARIAVAPGRYWVTRRGPDALLEGATVARAGGVTRVSPGDMQRVAYARVVRKGGTGRRAALSAIALAGSRGELADLGRPLQGQLGLRLDRRDLALELRAAAGASSVRNPRHTTRTRELTLTAAVGRAFDVGRFMTLTLALEAGAVWWHQRFVDPPETPAGLASTPARDTAGLVFGPVGQVDVALGARVYARVEAAAPAYLARTGNQPDAAAMEAHVTWRVLAGAGVFF